MHYGCRELYMTLSCRTVSGTRLARGPDRRILVFSRFSFSVNGGVNSVENKIWKIGAYSCSYVFSSISLLCLPVVLPPPALSRARFAVNTALPSTVIFWAGFYYGWHKWCKCISFNYATLRDTGVHVVVGFYAFPISCGIACLSNILSFSGYHSCCFTTSVINVTFNYATLRDKAVCA